MLRYLALVGFLGLACCASPASEDTADSSDAVTLGGAWRSSIDAGYYDDNDHSSLFVASDLTRQKIIFETYGSGGKRLTCNDVLDIPLVGEHAHEMRLNDEDNGCALVFSVDPNGSVLVKGTIDFQAKHVDVSLSLAPRKEDALVGEYVDGLSGNTLRVTASSNASITLSVTFDQREVAPLQTAEGEGAYDWFNVNKDTDCPLVVSFSHNSEGKHAAFLSSGIGATEAKCPAGLPGYFIAR